MIICIGRGECGCIVTARVVELTNGCKVEIGEMVLQGLEVSIVESAAPIMVGHTCEKEYQSQ